MPPVPLVVTAMALLKAFSPPVTLLVSKFTLSSTFSCMHSQGNKTFLSFNYDTTGSLVVHINHMATTLQYKQKVSKQKCNNYEDQSMKSRFSSMGDCSDGKFRSFCSSDEVKGYINIFMCPRPTCIVMHSEQWLRKVFL